MEEIRISEFKAACFSVLENVRKTGRTVLVTRFGQPVAEIIPRFQKAEKMGGLFSWNRTNYRRHRVPREP
jgi:prevent-host-death family protein